MSYGIAPSHRDEQRRKQATRLFIEERLIDLGHLAIASANLVSDTYDLGAFLTRKTVNFGVANKRYTAAILIAAVVVLAMVL